MRKRSAISSIGISTDKSIWFDQKLPNTKVLMPSGTLAGGARFEFQMGRLYVAGNLRVLLKLTKHPWNFEFRV